MAQFIDRQRLGLAAVGQMNTPVTIQKRATVAMVDDSGFPTDNADGWTTLSVNERMFRRDVSGMERFEAAQLSAPFETQWQMHYRPDMDPNEIDVAQLRRLVAQGRTYDIVGATVLGNKSRIELMTLARVG